MDTCLKLEILSVETIRGSSREVIVFPITPATADAQKVYQRYTRIAGTKIRNRDPMTDCLSNRPNIYIDPLYM